MPENRLATLMDDDGSVVWKAIDEYFIKLTRFLDQKLSKNKYAIVLIGSLARGEATIVHRRDLWSDLEYFIFYESARASRKKLRNDVAVFNKDNAKMFDNELFHIDFSLVPRKKIGKLPPKLLIFEAKSSHVVIAGEDPMDRFPVIDLDHFDFEDLNDVLTHRLFSIFYYGLKTGRNGRMSENLLRYVIARNSLDLLTVLLPCLGYLISGYQKRQEFLLRHIEDIRRAFPSLDAGEFADYMKTSLEIKLNPIATTVTSGYLLILFLKYVKIIRKIILKKKKKIYYGQLGMIKRGLIKRRLPPLKKNHYQDLYQIVKNSLSADSRDQGIDGRLKKEIMMRNYLLYGYPT